MSNLRLFQIENNVNKFTFDLSELINIEFIDLPDNHRCGIQIKQIMNEGPAMSSSRNLPCFNCQYFVCKKGCSDCCTSKPVGTKIKVLTYTKK